MGGHGGLNILPQKSWNVYNARNRARVAADEAQADIDAANARVEVAAEQARQNLHALRARAAASGEDASFQPPPALENHVNLFADIEAAELHAERDAARKREDARLVAKLMPDLDLSKSAREPAPWYAQPPPAAAEEEEPVRSSGSAGSGGSGSANGGEHGSASAMAHESKHRKRRHRDSRDDDESAGDGDDSRHRHRHHKHKRRHSRHEHERDRRRQRANASASPEASKGASRGRTSAGGAELEALAQMRQERLAREQREQMRSQQAQRPMAQTAAQTSRPESGTAAGNGNAALRDKFLALTGQQMEPLKPRGAARPRERARTR